MNNPSPGGAGPETPHRRRASRDARAALSSLVALAALPVAGLLAAPKPAAAATLTVPTSPATQLCGVANPGGGPTGTFETPDYNTGTTAPSTVTTNVVPSSQNVDGFAVANGDVYARTNTQLLKYSEGGALLSTINLPTRTPLGAALTHNNENDQVVIDPSGNAYVVMFGGDAGAAFTLFSLAANGGVNWSMPISYDITALYPANYSGGWALALVGNGGAPLINEAGAVVGTAPVKGAVAFVNPSSSGYTATDNTSTISFFTSSGSPVANSPTTVSYFGDNGVGVENGAPGAMLSFIQLGGSVQIGSNVYVEQYTSGSGVGGIAVYSPTGVFEGQIGYGQYNGANLQGNSDLEYDASSGELFVMNTSGGVVSVPVSTVNQFIKVPEAPPQDDGFGDFLGVGAELNTPATADYFPSGTTPSVNATFEPWWVNYPDALQLSYWVASADQVQANNFPSPTLVSVKPTASGENIPLTVQNNPGVYLVNADLVDRTTGNTIGSTCLTYSVGMPGDSLNFSNLASGSDYGGPAPVRGVELAAELGSNLFRYQLNLGTLFPNCGASPNPSNCGPSALAGWSNYDPAFEQAAQAANQLGVSFVVQIGATGGSTDSALVSNGWWQEDVQAIAEHLATSAPDLKDLADWNEPNTGYNATQYFTEILKPFYAAVQASNAATGKSVQVVGGNVLEAQDASGGDFINSIIADGALQYMNVFAVHPYTGYNRSFEEQGMLSDLQTLRTLLNSNGASTMPIWLTEQAYWSEGEGEFYAVGDFVPREYMLLRSLNITRWAYFIEEGGYQAGTDYSLIDTGTWNGDADVKPAAIGLMTAANLVAGRPYEKNVNLGIPHSYAELFGGSSSDPNDDVLAVWTDGLNVPAEITTTSSSSLNLTATEALGSSSSVSVSASSPSDFTLSGAPLYLTFPASDTVNIQSQETFGPNLALASAGATATDSSDAGGDETASAVIQGTSGGQPENVGDTPGWIARTSDTSPWVAVTLPSAQTVDRVIVSTTSLGSVLAGLRDFAVQLQVNGAWSTVANVSDQYFQRMEELSFSPVANVTGIRIQVNALDYGSWVGGMFPYWWSTSTSGSGIIYSVEAYGPGAGAAAPPGTTTTTIAPTTTTTTTTTPTTTTTTTTAPTTTTTTTPATTSPLEITSAASTTFATGTQNAFTVTAADGDSSAPTLTETGSLPGGVSFVDNGDGSATLSGSPAADSSGTYQITVTATDGVNPDATQDFALTVDQPPSASPLEITSAASTTFATGTQNAFTVTTADKDSSAPTLTETGSLPGGVSFVDNGDGSATLSGSPAADSSGTYQITVTATDGVNPDATQDFALTVDQPPSVTTLSLSTAIQGVPYVASLAATAGAAPLSWSLASGSLPLGISLSPSGVLSGTPSSSGTFVFVVEVADADGEQDTATFLLSVLPPFGSGFGHFWGRHGFIASASSTLPTLVSASATPIGGIRPAAVPLTVSCAAANGCSANIRLVDEVAVPVVGNTQKGGTVQKVKPVAVASGKFRSDRRGRGSLTLALARSWRALFASAARSRQTLTVIVTESSGVTHRSYMLRILPPRIVAHGRTVPSSPGSSPAELPRHE